MPDIFHVIREKKNERSLDNPGLGKSSNSANANYYYFQAPPVNHWRGFCF
jgi:hypothetical protein